MDAARWERIQALFHEALDRPESEWQAFLEAECRDDTELVADVLALLQADAEGASPLAQDLAELARDVFDGSVPSLKTVGSYHIVDVLGRGGMGVVYLAKHEDLGRQVAIKVLRDASLSPARRERFAREEQMLAQLNHPSIARLYDADVLPDGTPYFVMEYVEGIPLTEYWRAHECSIQERLRLFRAVCEAVQYAHRQAVIHRDLKPSNILVSEDGQVKLLDFGIAKQLENLETPVAQTQTELRLMTPAYAAPEQLRGEAVGVYTDVYALGVVLYELLTGQHPLYLQELTPGQVETLILECEPQRPSAKAQKSTGDRPALASSVGKQAWADLDVLCLAAMHKDPQRRYPTVEALMRDLDHFLEGKPLEARPDSWGYRMGKFLRRHRHAVAAAALVAAVLIGLTAFYTVRLTEQRNRAQAEAEKAEQVSDYLISLFEASDPFTPAPDSLNVRALLQHGVMRAEELSGQPAVQAQMLDVLGLVYTQLSQYDRADSLLRRALALRRAGDDPLDVAETLANLGMLHYHQGAHDSAEVALREAIAIRERHLSPNHPDLAATLSDLGTVLTDRGEYEEAEMLYRLALRMQRIAYTGPHEELSTTLSNLGVNFFNQGNHAAAERYYREALGVSRAVFGPEHPSVAEQLSNLAMVLEAQGDLVTADSMLTEALRIRRLKLGDQHYYTAFGLVQLGSLMRRMENYDRSERYLREAVAINEELLGPGHLNTTVARNHLALTLRTRGNLRDAEPLLRRAVENFRAILGNQHYYTGSSLCQLADVLHQTGEGDAAEPLFREGLSILKAVLPADHAVIVLHERNLGALLAAQSRFAEAEPLLLDSYESLHERRGPGHRDTRRAAQHLVELYEAWGKPEEAVRFQAELTEAAPSE